MSKEQISQNKKSFILHADLKNVVDQLPDETKGKLFKLILDHVNGLEYAINDLLLSVVFEPIKSQLNRDNKKWEDVREKRSRAGKASADKRQHMSTHVESVEQNPTHVDTCQHMSTVNVSDSVSVSDNVNVNDTVTDTKKIKQKRIVFDFTDFTETEIESIHEWINFRKTVKKKPYITQGGLTRLRNHLLELKQNNHDLTLAIDESINEKWQTPFPPTEKRYKKETATSIQSALNRCNDQTFTEDF